MQTLNSKQTRSGVFSWDTAFITCLILPNLWWVARDRGVWVSDAALFGIEALKLHHAAAGGVASWWSMFVSLGPKPPLMALIGSLLVPLGTRLGQIDATLLLLPWMAQWASLMLLHRATETFVGSRRAARIACVLLASAPMFMDIGKQYYTQTFQLAILTWFFYIASRALQWDRLYTLLHLTSASAVAMLTMLSTPLFVLLPGVVALNRTRFAAAFPKGVSVRLAMMGCVTGALLVLLTGWYVHQATHALAYARYGFNYSYGGIVGDNYVPKLLVWAQSFLSGAALQPVVFGLFVMTIVLGVRRLRRVQFSRLQLSGNALRLAMTLYPLGVLLVLSRAELQESRYVLPLIAYAALAAAWWATQANMTMAPKALGVVFGGQLIAGQLAAFGVIPSVSPFGRPLQLQPDRRYAHMDFAVKLDDGAPRRVLLATATTDLYSLQVEYHAAKQPGYFDRPHSEYRGAAFVLTSAEVAGDVENAWRVIQNWHPDYVIVPSDDVRAAERREWTSTTHGWAEIMRGSLDIAELVLHSKDYEQVPTPEYPNITLLKARPAR